MLSGMPKKNKKSKPAKEPKGSKTEAKAVPSEPKSEPRKSAPVAVIDIGSNAIRLAVAKPRVGGGSGGFVPVYEARESTRLAQGLDLTGRLDPHAMERSVDAIAKMLHSAKHHGAEEVRVVATCAVREAENAHRFTAMVKAETGVEIEIISGEEEGRLAYLGASKVFDLRKGRAAVLDIGGGSTELAISKDGHIEKIVSLSIGAVRLTERFGGHERAPDVCDEMKRYLDHLLNKHLHGIHETADVLIATGGTGSALAIIDILSEHPGSVDAEDKMAVSKAVQGRAAKRSDVKEWLRVLRNMTPRERERVPGLSKDRSQVIVAGLMILHRVMKCLRCKKLVVGAGSIRDGVIAEMLSE